MITLSMRLQVTSIYGPILMDRPGIVCVGLRPTDQRPPLLLVADEAEKNPGASATNTMERILETVAKVWTPELPVKHALIIEKDSTGAFDHVYAKWLGSDYRCQIEYGPLRYPGQTPRTEAAFRALYGDMADLALKVLAETQLAL